MGVIAVTPLGVRGDYNDIRRGKVSREDERKVLLFYSRVPAQGWKLCMVPVTLLGKPKVLSTIELKGMVCMMLELKRAFGGWVFLFPLVLFSIPAYGNEESQLLVGIGLNYLNAGNHQEAVKQFASAVEKDPRDETALFYYMLALVQGGDPEGALRVYDQYKPSTPYPLFLRGLSAFLLNRNDQAKGDLRRFYASAVTPGAPDHLRSLAPNAAYYLGVIAYLENNGENAREYLVRAKGCDPALEPYRRLYLGLVYLSQKKEEDAQKEFDVVKREYATSPARELMEEVLSGRGPSPKVWYLYGQLFEQYDSNPALVQRDLSLASIYHPDLTSTTRGVRTNFLLGFGLGTPGAREGKSYGLYARAEFNGYGGFHHANPALRSYNLLAPMVILAGGIRQERFSVELPLTYRRTWLGGGPWSFYNQQLGVAIQTSIKLDQRLSIYPGISGMRQDFGQGSERNGNEFSLPLGVSYQERRLGLFGGYTFTSYRTLTSSSSWKFISHTFALAPGYRLLSQLSFYLQGQYTFRSFPNPFLFPNLQGASIPKDRRDSEINAGAGLQIALGSSFTMLLGYLGSFNQSIPEFSFERHIVTLSLGAQL